MSKKGWKPTKNEGLFRSKGSNSFYIGDHCSLMGYGSFPTSQWSHTPVLNQSPFLYLPLQHQKLRAHATIFLAMTSNARSPLSRTEFHSKFQTIQDVLKNTLKVSIQSKADQGLVTNLSQDNIVFKKRIQLSAKSLLSNGWQFQSDIFIWNPLDKIVFPASRSDLPPFDLKWTCFFAQPHNKTILVYEWLMRISVQSFRLILFNG